MSVRRVRRVRMILLLLLQVLRLVQVLVLVPRAVLHRRRFCGMSRRRDDLQPRLLFSFVGSHRGHGRRGRCGKLGKRLHSKEPCQHHQRQQSKKNKAMG